ncbi:hypothetical protein BGW80DRAFT_1349852 [Lactifluus volemus]|nr:hypothetical protein BGW80DRAFT_1349852 [Lactifluus volemus]
MGAYHVVARVSGYMGFGSVFMCVCAAVPNKRSLGATNGLAQTVVSIQGTVELATAVTFRPYSQDRYLGWVCHVYCTARRCVW